MTGHARDYGARDCHDAGVVGRVRADRLHERHHRSVVQAVRADHFGGRVDQYRQRTDAQSGLVRDRAAGTDGKEVLFLSLVQPGLRGHDRGYAGLIRWTVRLVLVMMLVFAGLVALTGWSFGRLPTGFVPTEDQGYVFVELQLPDAASKQRTIEVMEEAGQNLCEHRWRGRLCFGDRILLLERQCSIQRRISSRSCSSPGKNANRQS